VLMYITRKLFPAGFRGFMVRKKWGPILEERIKQIVITHHKEEDAKKALQVSEASHIPVSLTAN
jgi:hypothetical protein